LPNCCQQEITELPVSELRHPGAMIKTILVPLTGFAGDEAALETAYLTARLFGAHLECLHVRPQWTKLAPISVTEGAGASFGDEFFAAFEQETKTLAWRAHRHFAEFCRRRNVASASGDSASTVSATLRTLEGDPDGLVADHGRFHDLVVLGRNAASGRPYAINPAVVIISGGRPVLLAAQKQPENLAPIIAIAWKETAEAARAITAAMPLLMKAESVVILAADEGQGQTQTLSSAQRAAEHLRWHGFDAKARCVALDGQSAADAVFAAARGERADLLVMGAYGRARLREFIFGGFTQDVLRECPLPVLFFH
jgi:nucleotide-binding universal stress UspA family protein